MCVLKRKNQTGIQRVVPLFLCILTGARTSKLHRCHRLQAATCLSVGQFDNINQPSSQSFTSAIGCKVKMVSR